LRSSTGRPARFARCKPRGGHNVSAAARLQARPNGGPRFNPNCDRNPHASLEHEFSSHPEQGNLIYLLCRTVGGRRVAEFATSIGMSTLYFVARCATMTAAESAARRSWQRRWWPHAADAGLADWVDIHQGDARDAWGDVGSPVDGVLIALLANFLLLPCASTCPCPWSAQRLST
jgi:predicted O-methyltransferase YrrM